ncbi:MAG: hypothetical protein ACKVHP_25265 [Verrucomicrobiales bacterium]|jgi:hypothetical protein
MICTPFRWLFAAVGSFLACHTQVSAIEVTFQVDLSIQQAIARFDPSTDIVELRGAFNGWTGGTELSADAVSPNFYLLPIDLEDDPGVTVEYKFAIVDRGGVVIWEGDVGEGQSNRAYVQEEADHALPVAFFDNLDVDPGAGVEVTFLVDMAARIQDDLFDPENDYVSVRGPFNNWEGNEPMVPVEEGSTVYQASATVKFILPGSKVPHKFIINSTEWEGADNRLFELADQSQSLPVRYFDDVEPAILLPIGALHISTISDGSFTLSWENAEAILQGSADLSEGWDDIPAASGQTQLSLTTELARKLFFRLVAP